MRELHPRARSGRPDRSALGGVGLARTSRSATSTHLFLKQSQFVDELRAWIDSHKSDWPLLVTSIANKWLDEGLQDRGITRDLEWGIPVPDDIADGKLKGKVFYVWFDAPIEYIAATKEWADTNRQGRCLEATGGSATRPRTSPIASSWARTTCRSTRSASRSTIMGSGEPWKLVDRLKGFNWLNYDGGKFSTSQKRGIFMDTALEILPADYWRYYLIANAPESADSNFTWEHFAGRRSTRTWPTCSAISSTASRSSASRASTARCRARANMARTKRR